MKNKIIIESIKNKSYFNKAIEWYCDKYLLCLIERSWIILALLFLLICLSLSLLNIYILFPIKKDLNFIKYVNYTEDEFSVINKLNFNKEHDEYISIARYLVSKYVEIYESNKTLKQKYRENFIQKNSIYKIYQNFQKKIINETNNLSLSRRNIINKINIVKLYINRPFKNLITFDGNAIVIFKIEKDNKIEDQIVDISFTLSNIRASLNKTVPFKFIVNNYVYRKKIN